MTSRQLEILQHALGLDKYGRNPHPGYQRNHYCAGGDDVADCAELVAMGYMRSFQREWLPYFNCIVTEEGKGCGDVYCDCSYRGGYAWLWDQINGKDSWDANPWVWVYQFKLLEAWE